MYDAIDSDTTVAKSRYPSARLENVIPYQILPPGSCCVIIVGINDVADELTDNIYRRLEEHLVSLLRSANKVLVATLPFRHDLPAQSPTNDEILQVNAHICELCACYKGAEAVDLN